MPAAAPPARGGPEQRQQDGGLQPRDRVRPHPHDAAAGHVHGGGGTQHAAAEPSRQEPDHKLGWDILILTQIIYVDNR